MKAHIMIQIANGNIDRETAKAVLFDFGGSRGMWLPKSQIIVDLEDNHSATGILFIPIWLAKKNGLGWGDGMKTADEMSEIMATGKLNNIRFQ